MTDDLHTNVGGMLPNQPPAAWETLEQAIRIVRQTYEKINRDRGTRGLPELAAQPMTREHRANAIRFLLSGPQDVTSLAAATAQLLAFIEAVLRAEDDSVSTGDDAA